MGSVKGRILKRIVDRVLGHNLKDLPPPRFLEGSVSEYDVAMRDGVRLKTYVHFPKANSEQPSLNGNNDFPIIFVRNPYCYEFDGYRYAFQNFVKYGFILCFQSVRGRGASEGEFVPFENERNDGIDTVAWIKAQEWYSHKIVPMGVSYLAMSHLLYSDTWDSDFKTAVLSMYGGNLYNLAYESGMFRDEFFSVWAFQNNAFMTVDGDDSIKLYERTRDIPRAKLMQAALGTNLSFYDNLISSPAKTDSIWNTSYFMPETSTLKTPLCLITGWYDFTVREVLKLFSSLDESVRSKSTMLIGPWTHLMQNNGDIKTPQHQIGGFMGFKFALKWLLDFFYGEVTETGVKYYVINRGEFAQTNDLPKYNESRFFFGSGWRLTKNRHEIAGIATYVYNPNNPFKTLGGGSVFPTFTALSRRYVQCAARLSDEMRDDVMCFESPILNKDRTVLGARLELTVTSSACDTCFSVKLCVRENGKLYAFSYGITNIVNNQGQSNPYESGSKRKLIIDLSPVAFEIKSGSALALCITSSDCPSFHRHLNHDGKWCEQATAQKAVQTLILDESELKVYFQK